MAQYFGLKPQWKQKLDVPKGGPPALRPPTPLQRPKPPGLRGTPTSAPTKRWEYGPGGLQPQKFRPGTSLPGYHGGRVPSYMTPQEQKAFGQFLKGIGHLGGQVARANPYVRMAHMAFDLAYALDWDQPFARTEGKSGYDMTGWTLCCDAGGPDEKDAWKYDSSALSSKTFPTLDMYLQKLCGHGWARQCGTPLQVPDGKGDLTYTTRVPNPGKWRGVTETLVLGPSHPTIPNRFFFKEVWSRRYILGDSSWTAPPKPLPISIPQVAVPAPRATPPKPAWQESITPEPGTDIRFRPSPLPYQRPSVTIEIPEGVPPGTHIPPKEDFHDQLPPPRNEKEKKSDPRPFAGIGGWLFWLYNGATEADEIVDILYDNLGKKCKGAKSMSEKAYCIYKNLDSLDIDSAVPELVWNHIEDKAWGAFFGLGKHAPFGAQLPGGTQPQVQLSRRKDP